MGNRVAGCVLVFVLATASIAGAQTAGPNDSYDAQLTRFLTSARKPSSSPPVWMAGLTTDLIARRVNDLVTIRVIENVSASGSADSGVNKAGSADVTLPMVVPGLSKVVPSKSETKFAGSGSTNRSSQISAMMTARVVEVLGTGDLVIEGVREVGVNGDQQVLVLTGVVRVADLEAGNVVPSTFIGQLRIRSFSRGLIKDSLTPGWLIRALQKVF